MSSTKTLTVIGGGAAGIFCAVNAARMNPRLKVVLLEKTSRLLSKVKISGGGRCNVTHACFDIETTRRQYPRGEHFVKKAFHQFFTSDTIQWFEERGVKLKTEEDGRMFPVTNSSQTIIDCLLREAGRYGVEIRMHAGVEKIRIEKGEFILEIAGSGPLHSDFVCIACGGYPKSTLFHWLTETGHSIEEPVPSLFTFNMPGHPITRLMGLSRTKARVKIKGTRLEEEGPLLITHWGLSGPVILKLSAWGARELHALDYTFEALVNWLPATTEQDLAGEFKKLRHELSSQKLFNRNPFGLPQRLWEFLIDGAGIEKEKRWADLASKEQNRLTRDLCSYAFKVKGKTTFKEEFVTAGGIRLNEIDPQTMMSKKIKGLFFAGEVLDVDGITGGFNFQHAWTSGWIAAKGIVGEVDKYKSV